MEETLKRHAPGDDFSGRVRQVLAGVPRVNFYDGPPRCPEDFSFPSALRAREKDVDAAAHIERALAT